MKAWLRPLSRNPAVPLKALSLQKICCAPFAGDNLNLNPPFLTNGNQVIRLFNPSTQNYSVIAEMDRGRWYPTIMSMADGNLLVLGGMQQVRCQHPASLMHEHSLRPWLVLMLPACGLWRRKSLMDVQDQQAPQVLHLRKMRTLVLDVVPVELMHFMCDACPVQKSRRRRHA